MARYRVDVELVYGATLEVEASSPEEARMIVYDGDFVIIDGNDEHHALEIISRPRELAEDGSQS